MNTPRVSVIVTAQGTCPPGSLLEALDGQAAAAQCEVIVVLDDPTRHGPEVRRWAEETSLPTRVVEPSRAGLGAARNRGVDAARGEIILFLDSDVLPAADLVERHLDHHDRDVVVVGDIKLAEPPRERHGWRSGWREQVVEWARREDANQRRLAPNHRLGHRDLHANNLSLSRTRFNTLRGFDEDLGEHGGEDLDLAERVLRSGCPIVIEPRAVAMQLHFEGGTDDPTAAFDGGSADVGLARKHRQLIPDLRLAQLPPGPIGWLAGRTFDLHAVARIGRMLLRALAVLADRLGFHGVWRRSRRAASVLAYWQGVAAAVGSRRDWEVLRRRGGSLPAVDLDLATEEPVVALPTAVSGRVIVRNGDRQVGHVTIPAGLSRDPRSIASLVAQSIAPEAIIEAAGTPQLRALTGDPANSEGTGGQGGGGG